jgi:hypothetical protein
MFIGSPRPRGAADSSEYQFSLNLGFAGLMKSRHRVPGSRQCLTRSDLVREALERQFVLLEFASARRKTRPFAERAGWLTDEDVFDAVS